MRRRRRQARSAPERLLDAAVGGPVCARATGDGRGEGGVGRLARRGVERDEALRGYLAVGQPVGGDAVVDSDCALEAHDDARRAVVADLLAVLPEVTAECERVADVELLGRLDVHGAELRDSFGELDDAVAAVAAIAAARHRGRCERGRRGGQERRRHADRQELLAHGSSARRTSDKWHKSEAESTLRGPRLQC
jgi:hypothetical protein